MRPFEILLVATALLSLIAGALSLFVGAVSAAILQRLSVATLVLTLIALALHLTMEGAHWQMFSIYGAVALCAWLAWIVSRPGSHGNTHWPVWIGGLLLIAVGCASAYVVPMFELPPPTGPYAVGTSVLYMVDQSREENAPGAPQGKRELVVQLWYPAAPGKGRLATYRRREETTFESSYQAVLPTHSRLDAPVLAAAAPYPVLLFNPGWGGRRTQSTFLTEELASHGYIVAAIDHPYNSQPVAFPDGRVVVAQPVPAIELLTNTTPDEVKSIGNAEADKQANDDLFVLDELAKLNDQQGSRWYRTLDAANAGALGHSLGGAVSVQAWATDLRIHAALNLDGWSFGTQTQTGTRAIPADNTAYPLLFLYEDGYAPASGPPESPGGKWSPVHVEAAIDAWDAAHVHSLLEKYGGYWLVLKGSIHPTFLDKTITSPIARLSGAGPIDPRRAHRIVREYCVQFFDQALKGTSSSLLQRDQAKYPEMVTRIQTRAPQETASSAPGKH